MKHTALLKTLLVAIVLAALPIRSIPAVFVDVGIVVGIPPPVIPVYVQPIVPDPNYIWEPGYWAWGPGGYFWVPGTWVYAPDPGLLWTPGYWDWNGIGYIWVPGYWADQVGYYGDVDYGCGYYGVGYAGGVWIGANFSCNNSWVTNVDPRIEHTYFNRSIAGNRSGDRVSYVGGRGGLQSRPTAAQLAVGHERHFGMTAAQQTHFQTAAQDHNLLYTANRGRPSDPAVTHALSASNRPAHFTPLTSHDRSLAHTSTVPAGQRTTMIHNASPNISHYVSRYTGSAAGPTHYAGPSVVHRAATSNTHYAGPAVHNNAAAMHYANPAAVHHVSASAMHNINAPVAHHYAAPVTHYSAPNTFHQAPAMVHQAPAVVHQAPANFQRGGGGGAPAVHGGGGGTPAGHGGGGKPQKQPHN